MMIFEELTPEVRALMLDEFRAEQLGKPYRPKVLTADGELHFRQIMEEHLGNGNEVSLAIALSPSHYWVEQGVRITKRGPVPYFSSGANRAKVFATTDFNTWYVRALAKKLMLEGVEECQVYRAAPAYEPRGECLQFEGRHFAVDTVYGGHRRRYHPEEGRDTTAFAIPLGPNCHHSIRRPH